MDKVIAIARLVFVLWGLWFGCRLWGIAADERETDRHNEDVRQGQIWQAQTEARMRRERLEHLYDVTEIELNEIAYGPTPARDPLAGFRDEPRHTIVPKVNPEQDRIKKLGL